MDREDLILQIEQKWICQKRLSLGGLDDIEYRFGQFDEGPSFGVSYGLMYRPAPYFVMAIWNEDTYKGYLYEQDGFILHIPTLHFIAKAIQRHLSDLTSEYQFDLLSHLSEMLYDLFSKYDQDCPWPNDIPFGIRQDSEHDILLNERMLEHIFSDLYTQ
ncbi:hypothetical protein [Desertibacillus haloalkaliphilus]|uniref:hypothetical protein n=1 Tax=Desertibacillus haloalkaliphilus TaxID=1328930 RepID=UPI001C27604C|nr:hypothetical protein [Desertibacillus haloalkaliphilus]MBU8907330.1 hypothetical protein [Desertibacillus haloalkaliphilus]